MFIMGSPIYRLLLFFFFNDTATTEIYTLSLHDALPISMRWLPQGSMAPPRNSRSTVTGRVTPRMVSSPSTFHSVSPSPRSEEHTSELQSRQYLVCRLLLEKKK